MPVTRVSKVIEIKPRNLFSPAKSIKSIIGLNEILSPVPTINVVIPRTANIPLPISYVPKIEHQHKHFDQGFGGYRADGGVMGPSNWQARNWFSSGTLREDGVRWLGRCCGDGCRNGGLGCCGKCPRCIDCP